MNELHLFHVTPLYNTVSIKGLGVSPDFSRGTRKVSWWVSDQGIVWAGAHVSNRWFVPTHSLVVFDATIDEALLGRTAWPTVFTAKNVIRPDGCHAFGVYLPLLPR